MGEGPEDEKIENEEIADAGLRIRCLTSRKCLHPPMRSWCLPTLMCLRTLKQEYRAMSALPIVLVMRRGIFERIWTLEVEGYEGWKGAVEKFPAIHGNRWWSCIVLMGFGMGSTACESHHS